MRFNIFDANTHFLNKHLAAEDQAERDEQERQTRITAALQPGGDYYPFSPENFDEAIRNMPDESVEALRVSFLDAQRSGGLHYYKPSVLLEVLVKKYWQDCAKKFC